MEVFSPVAAANLPIVHVSPLAEKWNLGGNGTENSTLEEALSVLHSTLFLSGWVWVLQTVNTWHHQFW